MSLPDRGPEDTAQGPDLARRLHQALNQTTPAQAASNLTRTSPDDLLAGRLALDGGLITQEQLQAALDEREKERAAGRPRPLDEILVQRHGLKREDLARLQAEHEKRTRGLPNLPRYEVRELLGQGATAVVYRAWDRELRRPVAIKVLRETAALNQTARARFRREAQVAAGLAHPNLVAVHDAGETEGQLYLVMEVVEGRSLAETLREGKTPQRTLVQLLAGAASGIASAHAKGIIHRDLKPANILVTSDGVPKVGDFGLAHLVESSTELTKTGATLGTPLYMPPEQVEGRTREISPASDVYSLGAILYEMATGRPPHTGESTGEIYAKIVRDDPAPPRRLKPEISRDLETIILKAIEKPSARRYPTAEEFTRDLDRYLKGESIEARPVPFALRLWRKTARYRAIVLAAAACLALAAVLGAWAVTSSNRKAARIRETLTHARAREEERKWSEAREAYEIALREDGSNADARAGLARADAELRRSEREREERSKLDREAQTLLETARPALEDAFRTLYDSRAATEPVARRVEAARSRIEEAVRKAPNLFLGHYLLGRAKELSGDEPGAEESTRRAIALDPDFAPARYQLGRLLLARSYKLSVGATPEERDAKRPEAERLAREAAAEIARALERASGFEDALHPEAARAMLAFASGKSDAAREIARGGLKKFGDRDGREEFWWVLGLASSGEEQIESFSRALEVRPRWPLVLLARAGARIGKGELEEAIADCDAALRLHPEEPHALLNRGIARSQRGDLEGAIRDFDQAVAGSPADPVFRYNRGVTRLRRGSLDDALADFDETIRVWPTFAPALNNRATVRLRKSEIDLAIADLNRAAQLKPDFAPTWANRGTARMRKGDIPGALADFGEAVRLDPSLAEAWYNRAVARTQKDDLNGAVEDLARAIELRPAWSAPYGLRARIRALQGNTVEARKDARRALDLGTDPEDRKALESLLKSDE